MQSIFISRSAYLPQGVSGMFKDQKFYIKQEICHLEHMRISSQIKKDLQNVKVAQKSTITLWIKILIFRQRNLEPQMAEHFLNKRKKTYARRIMVQDNLVGCVARTYQTAKKAVNHRR